MNHSVLSFGILILLTITFQSQVLSASICGDGTSDDLTARLTQARLSAHNWLLDQRTNEWGWSRHSTSQAVLALQLSNSSWYFQKDYETQLTGKQFHVEILKDIANPERNKDPNRTYRPPPYHILVSRVPYDILALTATCHNVTNYYGVNLLDTLSNNMRRFHKERSQEYFQQALGVLAMCSIGEPIKWKYVEDLLVGQHSDGCFHRECVSSCDSEMIDVTSIAVAAMLSAKNRVLSHHHETLQERIHIGLQCILNSQRNATAGNVVNKAWLAQALIAADIDPVEWNCEGTINAILDSQHPDGHFGHPTATAQILPLLAGRHHGSVIDILDVCKEGSTVAARPTPPEIVNSTQVIHITLVTESSGKGKFPEAPFDAGLLVTGVEGETLLDFMRRAQSNSFRFEYQTTSWGPYVTRIHDFENEGSGHRNWILQKYEGGQPQCIDKGVDQIKPEDGDTYVWMYTSCNPSA